MKIKLTLSIALFTALTACQDADVVVPQDPSIKNNATMSSTRSMKEAIEIAVNAAHTFDNSRSRAAGRSASVDGIKVITDTKSRSGSADSLLYVVNFDDEQGFALVPVPRTEKEILAVVDEGSYDPTVGTDNPGFNLYLEAANDYVKYQAANGGITPQAEITPALVYKTVIDTIAEYGKFQRLGEMSWGELTPYNKFTPNGYAGCAPVAMGMIIVNKGPANARIHYTFDERDVEYEDVNWINLLYHKRNSPTSLETNHICYSPDKEATHNSIARLIRQIGEHTKSNYRSIVTTTEPSTFESTLKFFLPNQVVTPLTTFRTNSTPEMDILNWGFLLMTAEYSGGRHTWVAEGYHYLKTEKRVFEYDPDTKLWNRIFLDIIIYSACYFNWGWNGQHNGYYENVVFQPYSGMNLHTAQYVGVCNAH